MFPPEIFEKIILYCDGITIKNARRANTLLRCIVDKLTMETELWKLHCYSDIPRSELIQYLDKWVSCEESKPYEKWWWIHENWMQWKDKMSRSEKTAFGFDVLFSAQIPSVTCISASGEYLAVGFENGSVKIFIQSNTNIQAKKTFWHLTVPVSSVAMIRDDIENNITDVVIYYGHNTNKVMVYDFPDNDLYEPVSFIDCFKYSCYKNYICGVSHTGKVTIVKIVTDVINRRKSLLTVTYVRIYSPDVVSQCTLWDGVCTLLINDKVKKVSYEDEGYSTNLMAVGNIKLDFSSVTQWEKARDIYIFKDKIIISLTEALNIKKIQLFELFILGESNLCSKKLFMPKLVFQAEIRCMFLYGNTFVIGTNKGDVYFYSICDWKLFNLNDFVHKESIGNHSPIRSIDVIESVGQRAFYVSTTSKIIKILAFAIPVEDLNSNLLPPAYLL